VPVGGDRPLRRVNVPLWFDEPTYTLDDEPHELPIPERTLELESLTAARQCPPFEPRLVR
jgi:hypothetical protein